MNLFAEVGDQPLAVGRSADGKSYQVNMAGTPLPPQPTANSCVYLLSIIPSISKED